MPGPMSSATATPAPQSVPVQFQITVPRASSFARRPAYISAATESASITVTPSGGTTVVNCTNAGSCSGTIAAPVGVDTFSVNLYDAQNAGGNLLSTGTVTQTIAAYQGNTVFITFNGVVASLSISLNPTSVTVGTPDTGTNAISVTVNAIDADGNIIVGPGNYANVSGSQVTLSLSDSDASGHTSLSQTSLTQPTSGITLSYDGTSISSPVTISLSATSLTTVHATLTVNAATPSPSPNPSATPSPTPTPSPSATPTPSPTPSPSPTPTATPTPNPSASPTPNFGALSTYLANLVSGSQSPQESGLGFVIVYHGNVIYENALGNQTTSSEVLIDSASKMPSDLAILTLVDRGLINLDSPISTYLPASFFPSPAPSSTPGLPTVTMRQLLSHTSGVNNCGSNTSCTPGSEDSITGAPCLEVPKVSMESCAEAIAGLNMLFSPGTEFQYGGDDMQLGGYVAQVVSGEPFVSLFQNAIETPCGISTTTTYYGYGAGSPPATNPRLGGGIYTNLADYAKLLELNLAGGKCGSTQVISQTMLTTMQQDYSNGLQVFYTAYPLTTTDCNAGVQCSHDYGMSWWHVSPPNAYSSTGVVMDFGSEGSTPWIDFNCGYGAFLLMSDTAADGVAIMNYVINNGLITTPLSCPVPSPTAAGY
jgi:CubicO group peptidase (beta-lactamase class C family)